MSCNDLKLHNISNIVGDNCLESLDSVDAILFAPFT